MRHGNVTVFVTGQPVDTPQQYAKCDNVTGNALAWCVRARSRACRDAPSHCHIVTLFKRERDKKGLRGARGVTCSANRVTVESHAATPCGRWQKSRGRPARRWPYWQTASDQPSWGARALAVALIRSCRAGRALAGGRSWRIDPLVVRAWGGLLAYRVKCEQYQILNIGHRIKRSFADVRAFVGPSNINDLARVAGLPRTPPRRASRGGHRRRQPHSRGEMVCEMADLKKNQDGKRVRESGGGAWRA
jgi:hypothetical protein